MAFPTETFLQYIRTAFDFVAQEFEHFYAQLEGYLRVEHREDGTHTAVTADSLATTGDVTVGGDLDVTGTVTADDDGASFGERSFAAGGTAALGSTVEVENTNARWALSGLQDAYDDGVALISATDGQAALVIYRVPGSTRFDICPPTGGTWTHHLGQRTAGIRWDEIAGTLIYGHSGFLERSRSVNLGEWASYTPTWSASGTAPALQDGTLVGNYTLIGKTCHFWLRLTYGASTTGGTGTWSFSLPATGVAPGSGTRVIGSATALDGATYYNGTARQNAAGTVTVQWPTAASATVPFTFASGDQLSVEGSFEIA